MEQSKGQSVAENGKSAPDSHYNTANFPTFVCNHGNWDIYKNDRGYCAAIPTVEAAADGCKASHFGDMEYLKITLPVEYVVWEDQQRKQAENKNSAQEAGYSVIPSDNGTFAYGNSSN